MKRSANYISSFAATYQTHIARSAKKKQPVHCTYALPLSRPPSRAPSVCSGT